jgi:hypothetical protein
LVVVVVGGGDEGSRRRPIRRRVGAVLKDVRVVALLGIAGSVGARPFPSLYYVFFLV